MPHQSCSLFSFDFTSLTNEQVCHSFRIYPLHLVQDNVRASAWWFDGKPGCHLLFHVSDASFATRILSSGLWLFRSCATHHSRPWQKPDTLFTFEFQTRLAAGSSQSSLPDAKQERKTTTKSKECPRISVVSAHGKVVLLQLTMSASSTSDLFCEASFDFDFDWKVCSLASRAS